MESDLHLSGFPVCIKKKKKKDRRDEHGGSEFSFHNVEHKKNTSIHESNSSLQLYDIFNQPPFKVFTMKYFLNSPF